VCVAIDRTAKFAYTELRPEARKTVAAQFLRTRIAIVPYKLHPIRTDHGIQFPKRKPDNDAFTHIFARVGEEHAIANRLTKTHHPWTHGQVERMKCTLTEATVEKYSSQPHQHLQEYLHACLIVYNCAKRLKTLRGLTPYARICQCWHKEPERFTINPYHHTMGLNI
jgi:hypothetical protein